MEIDNALLNCVISCQNRYRPLDSNTIDFVQVLETLHSFDNISSGNLEGKLEQAFDRNAIMLLNILSYILSGDVGRQISLLKLKEYSIVKCEEALVNYDAEHQAMQTLIDITNLLLCDEILECLPNSTSYYEQHTINDDLIKDVIEKGGEEYSRMGRTEIKETLRKYAVLSEIQCEENWKRQESERTCISCALKNKEKAQQLYFKFMWYIQKQSYISLNKIENKYESQIQLLKDKSEQMLTSAKGDIQKEATRHYSSLIEIVTIFVSISTIFAAVMGNINNLTNPSHFVYLMLALVGSLCILLWLVSKILDCSTNRVKLGKSVLIVGILALVVATILVACQNVFNVIIN